MIMITKSIAKLMRVILIMTNDKRTYPSSHTLTAKHTSTDIHSRIIPLHKMLH